jgi:hypothetical protein
MVAAVLIPLGIWLVLTPHARTDDPVGFQNLAIASGLQFC